jgi:fructose-1-phosphate kinase PfkB-like protein
MTPQLPSIKGWAGPDDVVTAAAELRGRGAEHVAITGGGQPAVLAAPDGILVATPPRVEVRDAVGAGDTFLGVLLLRLLAESDPDDALRWAVAAGATAAAAAGTSIGHCDQAAAILDQIDVQVG